MMVRTYSRLCLFTTRLNCREAIGSGQFSVHCPDYTTYTVTTRSRRSDSLNSATRCLLSVMYAPWCHLSGRFRGGPRGPGPPFGKVKKCKRGPTRVTFRFEVTEKKNSALLPPPHTESRRLLETTENFCYYPPHPLNRIGFSRSRKNSATTPPPLNRVDMALHTKAGPLLDLRLHLVFRHASVMTAVVIG